MNQTDFFSQYLQYQSGGEIPVIFHRWSAIAGMGAWLGRNCWIQFGEKKIYPNIYVMLIGEPATKKSTAIKSMKRLLKKAGYESFAPERTTKEKFLIDLAKGNDPMWETSDAELFIAADEFHDFFGNNILDFASLLGVLWDYEGNYETRIKNGETVTVMEPRVSVLGGNTPVMFNKAFPAEVGGQGFLSRLLLIHGKETGIKVTFPPIKSVEETDRMLKLLGDCRFTLAGECKLSPEVASRVDKIYKTWPGINDARFASYANRRLENLFKLTMIHTAARRGTEITTTDLVYANTVLHAAEREMSKALGSFGLARNGLAMHKLMNMLEAAHKPIDFKELWEELHTDLEKLDDLGALIKKLEMADKIQVVSTGIMPKRQLIEEIDSDILNFSVLTKAERYYDNTHGNTNDSDISAIRTKYGK